MATFFCRLNPPRPTFALDMTPEEGQLMQAHAVHWNGGLAAGRVIVFGLVGDPSGPFGIGVLEVRDEAEARAFTDADPVVAAGRGFRYDVFPMPMGAAHRGAAG